MYILHKFKYNCEDTDCNAIGCSKDKTVIESLKKKYDDELENLRKLSDKFSRDSFISRSKYNNEHPVDIRNVSYTPSYTPFQLYLQYYTEYDKNYAKEHPEYLPYLTEDGVISIECNNIEYKIEENVEEFFA